MYTTLDRSLFVVLLSLAAITPGNTSAQIEAIVWDATVESGCMMSIETDGVSSGEYPCPQGTIIAVQIPGQPSFDQDNSRNAIEALDSPSVEAAVASLALQPQMAPAACSAASRTINGRYNIGNGVQAYYRLQYRVNTDCSVTQVFDNGRADVANYGYWVRSCSNGASNCNARNMYLPTSATPNYAVPSSVINAQYRHVTAAGGTNYFGCWYFD